ncbi:hypothetical protein GCM10009766_04940 [Microcella frigidaquae]
MWALWDVHMRAGGCTDRTIRNRRIWFRELARTLGKPIATATKLDLVEYLGRAHLSPRTRQNYRSAMHTLFTLMQDEGIRHDNPAARLPRVHVARLEPHPFTIEEVQRLLESGIYGRTRLYVLLALYMGLRAAEIAQLRGEHVDWDRRRLWIEAAKGGVKVWRPLHPIIWEVIQTLPREGYWFPSHTLPGQPISPKSVSNTLCAAIKRAGMSGHRAHQLRATFATEMIRAGVSTTVASHAMRHANPATLSRYVKPDDLAILDAITKIPTVAIPTRTNRRRSPEVA